MAAEQPDAPEQDVVEERIAEDLSAFVRPVDGLTTHPRNPHRGDIPAIAESLRVFGQVRAILATGEGVIVAGNHTFLAAKLLGWEHIAVTRFDGTPEEAEAYLLADNRSSALGHDDDVQLAALLSDLSATRGLEGTLYAPADLGDILHRIASEAALARLADAELAPDIDDAPPLPEVPRSVLGEVYELGRHRVMCGDSTDPAAMEILMDGAEASCLWTDPPYGVDYESIGRRMRADAQGLSDAEAGIKTIDNDRAAGLPSLLAHAFAAADAVLVAGAPIYVAHPSGPLAIMFHQAFVAAGWDLRQNLVWVKDIFVMGHSDYHYKHEPILYGFKPAEAGRLGRGGRRWWGDHTKTSVFTVARPKRSEQHPTMKPVSLVLQMLANSVPPGGTVLDPFGGSGTTLLAADALGATAYLMEIDPAYVDVIRDRYEAI